MTARRGELWYATLNPAQGSEQAGTRPVLVVQNNAVNRFTTTVLTVPLTTNLRRATLPCCVPIAQGDGGLPADSVALCHQLRVLDTTRLQSKLGTVSDAAMTAVEGCILFTVGIS